MVRAHVGVDYDGNCLTTHRHLLVTGSPKPVQVSGRERNRSLLEKHAGREAEGGTATEGLVTKPGPRRPRRLHGPNRSVLSYLPRDVALEWMQQGFRTPGRKP